MKEYRKNALRPLESLIPVLLVLRKGEALLDSLSDGVGKEEEKSRMHVARMMLALKGGIRLGENELGMHLLSAYDAILLAMVEPTPKALQSARYIARHLRRSFEILLRTQANPEPVPH